MTGSSSGQTPPDTLQKILDRLDAIEKQNHELIEEVQSLRQQLKDQIQAQTQSTLAIDQDRINEQRVRELAQTKVEAAERFPISLTGMVLFDAYRADGTRNAAFQSFYPDSGLGAPGAGAGFNQSIIGLRFTGPQLAAGGHANGFLSMDFYAGSDEYQTFRLRRAGIALDWPSRSITFAKDKPLIAPYEPLSYARVGVPALAGAGNLWLWLPQVRYDERFPMFSGLNATFSAAVLETDENYGSEQVALNNRPALQSRFELKKVEDGRNIWSAGFGAHFSQSHFAGRSVPSHVLSLDTRFTPAHWIEVSGTVLTGENFANLGGIGPGVQQIGSNVVAVHGSAGWMQLSFPVTKRLTLDVYAGRQVNRGRDLMPYQVVRTFDVAGNALYRLAPNVVLGFEVARQDALYLNGKDIFGNRLDATVAYLF